MASKAPHIVERNPDTERGRDGSFSLLIVSAICSVLAVATLVV